MSTEKYKLATDAHRRNVESNKDDYVIARIRSERYPNIYLRNCMLELLVSFASFVNLDLILII